MIDTDNVVQFQTKNDLHRLFRPRRDREPQGTDDDRGEAFVLIYLASLTIVCMVIGWALRNSSALTGTQSVNCWGDAMSNAHGFRSSATTSAITKDARRLRPDQ